jgi:hypothetical protein
MQCFFFLQDMFIVQLTWAFCLLQTVQRASEWRPGVYVRVHGNLSDFENKWRVQAYHIRAVTDFNEAGWRTMFLQGV